MFDVWESLLQEVEVDSQIHADVAGTLNRQISRPLIEKTFYRKIQSRKVFTHRESFDTILLKTEDMLNKCRRDYSDAYLAHYRTQTNASLAAYFDAHNAYVQQLHATNGMLQEYNRSTLPTLLEELEAVYLDVSTVLADCILCGAHTVANRALEQSKRYESLTATCRSSDSRADVAAFVRCIEGAGAPGGPTPPHRFMPPHLPPPGEYPDGEGLQQEPPAPANLKDELILDRLAALSSRNRHEALKKEAADLERQIAQLQDSQETLLRIQQRNIEANLFNKVNEIQEDLSLKRFDLRVAQVHLSAVKAQKELFASKDSGGAEGRERKMSNSSGGSMKTKWMKAFKSLKTSEPSSGSKAPTQVTFSLPPGSPSTKRYTFSSTVLSVMANRKNCRDKDSAANFETAHIFQEYTYKKITACDVCHQILRGHSRQGLKCRMCKTNVHAACQDQVAKCQPKSRLLRRQRSTSEIEAKQMEAGDDDTTPNISFSSLIASQPTRRGAELPAPSTTTEIQIAPISPRRQKLNLRMKSFSLDSPESSEQVHRRHQGGSSHISHASSHSQSPSSPVHNRRLLTTRNMRMSSVELPDENEKSLSSASTSPCPSPVSKKPHRLLPTNLYVVLYNFTSRHPDELDLRAGYKVTVIDTSDPDWWQGKCLGRTGYFPSKYVTRLNCGEKPLQVTHNLQVTDGDNGIKLLRDQIVIQIGEEVDGMVMIRNGDNQQGVCPLKYLQEA
ncbi:SH3 and cysteine-rich domain-containing protein isoform X16 [Macrobrachium rosenbergii]|uniref:SH3 and cysteine-rich domain-containing protein isoform X16 n=1 Tax=Macrobrachium rosenbergii TaxID=79674 RepID=UPI0034D42E4A